jgi:molybdopterin-binding protein
VKQANERAERALELAGLAPRRDHVAGAASHGEQRQLEIAMALAGDPRLLLLDEPMAGLDVGVATALRIELAAHLSAYDGITLLVTHDAIDALTVAQQVLVVDGGRVAQQGTPAEVAQRPATEHVARLVGLNVIREGTELRSFSPTAVTVDLEEPRGSARNRWRGTVGSVNPHGVAIRVVVRATGTVPVDLIADVTPAAATELGLVPGRVVWLSVKETSVNAYPVQGR